MFHNCSKLPWKIKPTFKLSLAPFNTEALRSLWSCRYFATVNRPAIQQRLQECPPSSIHDVWGQLFAADNQIALDLRYEFYQRIRNIGLSHDELAGSSCIFESVPRERLRYADYLFMVELLLAQGDWQELLTLLIGLAKSLPTIWEKLMAVAIAQSSSFREQDVYFTLKALGESCLHLEVDLSVLTRDSSLPVVKMIQDLLMRHNIELLIGAIDSIASTNMVMASSLASALLRAASDLLIETTFPPNPLEGDRSSLQVTVAKANAAKRRQDAGHLPYLHADADALWSWMVARNIIRPEDLKIYMMYLVHQRRSQIALNLYDEHPELHDKFQLNEAVLLAAAGASDYARLQAVFEQVEQNNHLLRKLGSRRYAIVLSALGYLGDAGLLDNIYESLKTSHPELLTRGVFHALIHSHGTRGDLRTSLKYYDIMVARGIEPTYSTFSLVLRSFRDAMDLKGALAFAGDEMVAKHQFGMRNQELTLLLSLCGKRRDHESAQYIWEWGKSLIVPDRIAWNSYLHALVVANRFTEAWEVFTEMQEKNSIQIDTLTIMLNGAGQSRELKTYIADLIAQKEKLKLKGDDGWYVSLLSALAEWGDIKHFEQVMAEMKAAGIKPHASHYALYVELLAKTKEFAKHERVTQEMHDLRVPVNFAYIEKHFRLLVAPGSSPESRQAAHFAAMNLVRDGYFDPRAVMVPRSIVPVRTIEPVVRRLIKSGQFVSAKQLLDGLRRQRVSVNNVRDDSMIWALYMEIADASKNYAVVDKLWKEFTRSLPILYVLSESSSAAAKKSESGPADEVTETRGTETDQLGVTLPKYKIARRYRQVFWKAIDIRIKLLTQDSNREKIIELPTVLDTMGLAMNGTNMNSFIVALVRIQEADRAFQFATQGLGKYPLNLSNAAKSALASVVHRVSFHRYGGLGYAMRNLAKYNNSDRF